MTTKKTIFTVTLLCIATATSAGEVCPAVGPTHSDLETMLQVYFGPAAPYWATVDFDVAVTLEKLEHDGSLPCAFSAGSSIWVTFEVKNVSDEPYTGFFPNGKFWDVYLYEPHRPDPVMRFSDNAGYDDDRLFIDILPGESMTQRRIWVLRDPFHGDPAPPAGVYHAYGRFEPEDAPAPRLHRADTTISPRFTVVIVD